MNWENWIGAVIFVALVIAFKFYKGNNAGSEGGDDGPHGGDCGHDGGH